MQCARNTDGEKLPRFFKKTGSFFQLFPATQHPQQMASPPFVLSVPLAGSLKELGDLQIPFPFKPYPSQEALMKSLVHTFQQRTQALLESPTGSGKSLAILAASVSWLRHQKVHGLSPPTPLLRVVPPPAAPTPKPPLSASPNDSEFARPRLQVVKPLPPLQPPLMVAEVATPAPSSLLIIASRTHAQLDQLTSELEKLKRLGGPYRTIRAVHLASRQHVQLPLSVPPNFVAALSRSSSPQGC
jgi:hypothetical protein